MEIALFLTAILSIPSLFLFSFIISSSNKKVAIRNSILFFDIFSVFFMLFLVFGFSMNPKFIIQSNLFLLQIIFFFVLGMNLIFYFFYQEQIYKNVIDLFFSLPGVILFSLFFFITYISITFNTLLKLLNNMFFIFLLTYLNIVGYLLLAYYLAEKHMNERIYIKSGTLYLRLLGGVIFILSSLVYILMI